MKVAGNKVKAKIAVFHDIDLAKVVMNALYWEILAIDHAALVWYGIKGDAVFKNVQCTSYVIHLYELTDIIQEYRETNITPEEAAALSQNLALVDMRNEISDKEHVQSVKEQILQKQIKKQKAMENQYKVNCSHPSNHR